MPKRRSKLTIDEDGLRAGRVQATRTGQGDSAVIEAALRRDLGLDLLDRLAARNNLQGEDAMDLAVEAQHQTRRAKT
jgi:hypothetical protein